MRLFILFFIFLLFCNKGEKSTEIEVNVKTDNIKIKAKTDYPKGNGVSSVTITDDEVAIKEFTVTKESIVVKVVVKDTTELKQFLQETHDLVH